MRTLFCLMIALIFIIGCDQPADADEVNVGVQVVEGAASSGSYGGAVAAPIASTPVYAVHRTRPVLFGGRLRDTAATFFARRTTSASRVSYAAGCHGGYGGH